MPTSLHNVCFDAIDPYRLATFWSQVVDRPVGVDCEPGQEEVYLDVSEGPSLYFQRVPESKVGPGPRPTPRRRRQKFSPEIG